MIKRKTAHNRIDLTGQVFGDLTVMEVSPDKRSGRQLWWTCQCDCGKWLDVRGTQLRLGRTNSCGCRRKRPCPRYVGHGDISGAYWYMIRHHAFARNLVFDVTIEYCWDKYITQERQCALSGVPILFSRNYRDHKQQQTASLDRIDSLYGYIPGNVQWLHKVVNNMKQDYPENEFIDWCRRIAERRSIDVSDRHV
jgi:hypothetical protein